MPEPDKELASRIMERLRKAGLLSESALSKIEEGLSTGTLTTEGWRLIVELEISGKEANSL
jgi:hypothetical protein